MKTWTSEEIRRAFLEYFASKGHTIVASAPLVVKDDPTLMFTNAGMNQFKDLFLGNAPIKSPRIANSQKCLRVSGKHNDLEEVGVDTYHHTMFEMLGNWSFGDYFKKEALAWAWELLTEVYKMDTSRMYVTVFGGDEQDGLPEDVEAYNIWKELIGEDRIIKCSKKDNFWEMGDTGPCGPCSEIHVDIRDAAEIEKIPGKDLVNVGHPQVIEIWNNVFMEFNRMANGSLQKLPAQHVDTGMGFERLSMVLQGKKSNYDTDIFTPIIAEIQRFSGIEYKASDSQTDIAMRVIADHLRAISFSISDGQIPSNTGAGYVIRRILRRAVRYGFSFLGLKESFIHKLVPVLVKIMGHQFPEIAKQQQLVTNVIREEEEAFLRTLERGIAKFNEYTSKLTSKVIDGGFMFELYDTFGFPPDLTGLMARENGLSVDEEEFNKQLQLQKERSRKATAVETGDWVELASGDSIGFVGYDQLACDVELLKYRKVKAKGQELFQLVFNQTPFYPEGGGQVGDTGTIVSANQTINIIDTKKENNLIVHFSDNFEPTLEKHFYAKVNGQARMLTANNHSATHLLHYALRNVLGTHVEQKGSLVAPNYLRFDFSHFSKVTAEELTEIEAQVNAAIRKGIALEEFRNIPIEEAKAKGAMALFGEKYGDAVRMIKFGDSKELCGGCHVSNTAQIGVFKITTETAVAAGVRRIEAITSVEAIAYFNAQEQQLSEVKSLLNNPKNVSEAIAKLLEDNKVMQKEIEAARQERIRNMKLVLKNRIKPINDLNVLVIDLDLDPASVKDLLFQLRSETENFLAVIGSVYQEKPNLSIILSDNLVSDKGMNASTMVRELAKEIQGGGGGQAFFATAGGKNAAGISSALLKVSAMI